MIKRDKLYIVSSLVDSSIKQQIVSYDISIYKTFLELEYDTNSKLHNIKTLVLTSEEVPFTSINMQNVLDLLDSPFVKCEEVLYLIDKNVDTELVKTFVTEKGLDNWSIYNLGVIDFKSIYDVVSGEKRTSEEADSYLVTYRMKVRDYVARQNEMKYKEDSHYETEEEELQGVALEPMPEEIRVNQKVFTNVINIVGAKSTERTLFAFLMFQYTSLSGKSLIVESDVGYHKLSELATKSGIDCLYIDMEDLLKNIANTITMIRETPNPRIVVSCRKRVKYDYKFIVDLLISNLDGDVSYIVRDSDISEMQAGVKNIVVMPNNIPDILNSCNSIKIAVDPNKFVFIGVSLMDIYPATVNTFEMSDILKSVLGIENINCQVFKVSSLLLGGSAVYDLRSII